MSEDPWKGLSEGSMRRVDAQGRFNFFWAVVERNAPALVFNIQDEQSTSLELPKFRNLEIRYRYINGRSLVLSLLEGSQREIFETLCRNVVAAGEQAQDELAAIDRFVRRTRRWSFLLKGGSEKGLTLEEQRGLVGELACLRELARNRSPESAVEGWTGPDGGSKDFEFPDVCIEVKARRGAAKPFVRISSEDQLADVEGRRLFLRVYDVDNAVIPEGQNLHDHVAITQAMFEHDTTSTDQFENLLDAVGYDPSHEYGARRWIVGRCRNYEVVNGFPRIVAPLSNGVGSVTYSIELAACTAYESLLDPTKALYEA